MNVVRGTYCAQLSDNACECMESGGDYMLFKGSWVSAPNHEDGSTIIYSADLLSKNGNSVFDPTERIQIAFLRACKQSTFIDAIGCDGTCFRVDTVHQCGHAVGAAFQHAHARIHATLVGMQILVDPGIPTLKLRRLGTENIRRLSVHLDQQTPELTWQCTSDQPIGALLDTFGQSVARAWPGDGGNARDVSELAGLHLAKIFRTIWTDMRIPCNAFSELHMKHCARQGCKANTFETMLCHVWQLWLVAPWTTIASFDEPTSGPCVDQCVNLFTSINPIVHPDRACWLVQQAVRNRCAPDHREWICHAELTDFVRVRMQLQLPDPGTTRAAHALGDWVCQWSNWPDVCLCYSTALNAWRQWAVCQIETTASPFISNPFVGITVQGDAAAGSEYAKWEQKVARLLGGMCKRSDSFLCRSALSANNNIGWRSTFRSNLVLLHGSCGAGKSSAVIRLFQEYEEGGALNYQHENHKQSQKFHSPMMSVKRWCRNGVMRRAPLVTFLARTASGRRWLRRLLANAYATIYDERSIPSVYATRWFTNGPLSTDETSPWCFRNDVDQVLIVDDAHHLSIEEMGRLLVTKETHCPRAHLVLVGCSTCAGRTNTGRWFSDVLHCTNANTAIATKLCLALQMFGIRPKQTGMDIGFASATTGASADELYRRICTARVSLNVTSDATQQRAHVSMSPTRIKWVRMPCLNLKRRFSCMSEGVCPVARAHQLIKSIHMESTVRRRSMQVLCTMVSGKFGVAYVNRMMQPRSGHAFQLGDPVRSHGIMSTHTDKSMVRVPVAGTMGQVTYADMRSVSVQWELFGQETYTLDQIKATRCIQLAYAVLVHQFVGCKADDIVLLIGDSHTISENESRISNAHTAMCTQKDVHVLQTALVCAMHIAYVFASDDSLYAACGCENAQSNCNLRHSKLGSLLYSAIIT